MISINILSLHVETKIDGIGCFSSLIKISYYPGYTDEDLKTARSFYGGPLGGLVHWNLKLLLRIIKTIYSDKVRVYMCNNDALSLNGEGLCQTFKIHTGKDSCPKSTKFTILKLILSDSFFEITAETFTKQPKSRL